MVARSTFAPAASIAGSRRCIKTEHGRSLKSIRRWNKRQATLFPRRMRLMLPRGNGRMAVERVPAAYRPGHQIDYCVL